MITWPMASVRRLPVLHKLRSNCVACLSFALLGICLPVASEPPAAASHQPRPNLLLWGDTHLHTSLSIDARGFGVRLGPEQAYRFARGETVTSTHTGAARLARPLDFLVIADHSDGLGVMNAIIDGDDRLMGDPQVRAWHNRLVTGGRAAYEATIEIILGFTRGGVPEVLESPAFTRSVWDSYIHTADKFNEPGRFTALIGYEWTSTEAGNNLHRNVIYRGDAAAASVMLPYTSLESFNPEDLWRWMRAYEQASGSEVLALAHNANLSNGIMFPVEVNPATGKPLGVDYLRERARWEPLYEVTQIKGDSESHPYLSPNDEYAGHDVLWDRANLLRVPKDPAMLRYEYAREALKSGLLLEAEYGENPYRFGMIGSSDSHTALATADEDNFFGKHSGLEPRPDRWKHTAGPPDGDVVFGWEYLSSGYAAVWAAENTRDAIFAAMQRREVYATTGPRIAVRVFAGWRFSDEDLSSPAFEQRGYDNGVPMGGTLPPREGDAAPGLMIAAMKDPMSGDIDRLQVIKGWLDQHGETREQVYDLVESSAEGHAELRMLWTDPEFDKDEAAFYYVRVIEKPTPRWTAHDARRFEVTMDAPVPMTVRERAYTSPIWYSP